MTNPPTVALPADAVPTRVLLVEDEPFALAAIQLLLSSSDDLTVVGVARDGNQALTQVAQLRPDVVVLDLHLPGMSGVDVARRLRTIGGPMPFLLALTSLGLDESLAPALSAGVAGFVLKDSPESLVPAIRSVARGQGWLDPVAVPKVIATYAGMPARPPMTSTDTQHFWIVCIRVEDLTTQSDPAQLEMRRAMVTVARCAIADTLLSWNTIGFKDEDDGLTLFVPASVAPMRLIGPFIDHLDDALAEAEAQYRTEHRLRFRVSLHHGLVTPDETGWAGHAVTAVHRLVEAAPLRLALHDDPAVRLAVGISDEFHRTVVQPGHRLVRTESFRPFLTEPGDSSRATAWLYVPGSSPGIPKRRRFSWRLRDAPSPSKR